MTSSRDRRVLTLGVVVIALLVIGARGVPSLLRARHDALASAREDGIEAERARSSVAVAQAVSDSLRARNRRYLALAALLLDGETPAGAASTLAALVSGAAASSGVRLGSVQLQVDTPAQGSFTKVGMRADATGDIDGVMEMLAALERGPELLVVRELLITQPEPGAGDDRAEALRVEIVIEGLTMRRGGR